MIQQQLDRCLSVTLCSQSSASSAKKVCLTFFLTIFIFLGVVIMISGSDAVLRLKAIRRQVGLVEICCGGSYA